MPDLPTMCVTSWVRWTEFRKSRTTSRVSTPATDDLWLRVSDLHLEGAHLEWAHLERANLRGAHLETLYVNPRR
jgi:hypothetical protein